jgi:putative toxin-antitoxin system antitoxin component (TIGR02293 family)
MAHLGIDGPAAALRPGSARRPQRLRLQGSHLGVKASNSNELIRNIQRGFAFKALLALESRTGLAASRIASLIGIPERTLARRKASGRLSSDESERLLRISSIFEDAVNLFESDVASAVKWLTTPRKSLGSQPPLAYSRTELGAREVENLIGRMEHGIFS